MRQAQRAFWALLYSFLVAVTFVTAACGVVKGGTPPTALPDVSPLPSPTVQNWIVEISPRGEVKTLAQIRVIFHNPLIPLQAIEDPAQQAKLAQFVIDPQVPGRFRFLTPRMVGFQQDAALPLATRVRVTVKAGLSDLAGHTLTHDLAWTFTTAPIDITGLPEDGGTPGGLNPTLTFRSNVELDLTSLADHLSLVAQNTNVSVPVSVSLDTSQTPAPDDEDQPQYRYDASTLTWSYKVIPKQPLAKATLYHLRIAAGVRPARGNIQSAEKYVGFYRTFAPLAFGGLQRDAQSTGRFVGGAMKLSFNNPLAADSVQTNLSISPTPRSTAGLWQVDDGNTDVYVNQSWLTPATTYTITVGAGVADKFGQTLGKQTQTTVSTGDFTPNFWMPDGLNIFPADDDLQLDISSVNLPNRQYTATYRTVRPQDLVYWDSAYPDSSGSGLLPAQSAWPAVRVDEKKKRGAHLRRRPAREARREDRHARLRGQGADRSNGRPVAAAVLRARPAHKSRRLRAVVPDARARARRAPL